MQNVHLTSTKVWWACCLFLFQCEYVINKRRLKAFFLCVSLLWCCCLSGVSGRLIISLVWECIVDKAQLAGLLERDIDEGYGEGTACGRREARVTESGKCDSSLLNIEGSDYSIDLLWGLSINSQFSSSVPVRGFAQGWNCIDISIGRLERRRALQKHQSVSSLCLIWRGMSRRLKKHRSQFDFSPTRAQAGTCMKTPWHSLVGGVNHNVST